MVGIRHIDYVNDGSHNMPKIGSSRLKCGSYRFDGANQLRVTRPHRGAAGARLCPRRTPGLQLESRARSRRLPRMDTRTKQSAWVTDMSSLVFLLSPFSKHFTSSGSGFPVSRTGSVARCIERAASTSTPSLKSPPSRFGCDVAPRPESKGDSATPAGATRGTGRPVRPGK
jgi:hypothetical protein